MLLQNTSPFGAGPAIGSNVFLNQPPQLQSPPKEPVPVKPPETGLPRALNYYADYSGCGYWRMIWPEFMLNMYQKMIVHGTTCMVLHPQYYEGITACRIQRQASDNQLQFAKFLKELSQKFNFKLLFEIDDIMFHEDIPDYNKFKVAFTDPSVRRCGQEIMEMCDEITVTCEYMKDYYASKMNNKNITVLPNYVPKFWMDRFYDSSKISRRYSKHKKKPRILYPGSGAHIDVDNRTGAFKDDFEHVAHTVTKTIHEFQWVFVGAFPLQLRPLVQNGSIEFHEWKHLLDYPAFIDSLDCSAVIAPLRDNTFNKAKSDLKYVEAGCFGLPCVCQDLPTYNTAPIKFKTGDEMVDQLKYVFKSQNKYMKISSAARKYAETRWLEDNVDKYKDLYTVPKDSGKREHLVDNMQY